MRVVNYLSIQAGDNVNEALHIPIDNNKVAEFDKELHVFLNKFPDLPFRIDRYGATIPELGDPIFSKGIKIIKPLL